MKPKIFIGSSVEGLSAAYAIQQNLAHDAESTVWDQGFFELSKTTIESLDKALETMDFGIFVFSGDDITIMRGKESSAVRDNVLFEFGLFIGKLGRERVFFVIPDGDSIHMPTDLLGITPGRYNPNRQDKSLQAATGSVCNSIRIQIKKMGLLRDIEEFGDTSESSNHIETSEKVWTEDFSNKDFLGAKEKLEKQILTDEGDERLKDEVWMSYINFKINEKQGLLELFELYEKQSNNIEVVSRIMKVLEWENYIDKAIEFGKTSLAKVENKSAILINLANCYKKNGDVHEAQELLNGYDPSNNPDIAIALAEMKENKGEALLILHATYQNFPNNEKLVYKFARLLHDEGHNKEALYLYNLLTDKNIDNIAYWGYLGNTCVNLKLNDNAMNAYKKADELSIGSEAWIVANIGNLLSAKGFYTEGIKSFKKSLELGDESEYSHDRLASTIKNREEENKKFQNECEEGRKLLRHFNVTTEIPF
ncbi:MAG: nucleotide-binding protein [Sulfuricurvum sp.]|nr:nucleotide-binding protein [Sulfuricurvum sp.]